MTAMALEPGHDSSAWIYIGNGQHKQGCSTCGEFHEWTFAQSCSAWDLNGDETCDVCGHSWAEPEQPACQHVNKGLTNKGENHEVVCRDCLEVLGTETHDYSLMGTCACGAVKVCKHVNKGVTNKGENHEVVCRDCLEVLGTEAHDYSLMDTCACGAVKPAAPAEPECEHKWKGVANKDEATHNIVCRDCLEVLGTESHKYVDGRPCACGAIYVEDQCKHEWKGVVNNGADHSLVCRDCGEVLSTEAHKYAANGTCACGAICQHQWKSVVNKGADHDVICRDCLTVLAAEAHDYGLMGTCACGAIKPTHDCSFEAGVTSNGDGTHKVNCECGNFVTVNCLDSDGDGKCDSCGYDLYTHKCSYDAGVTSNEDGTHNINCECGKFVTIGCLDNDGDGKCDSCGYQKYTAPEDEHEHNYVAHSNNDGTHLLTCSCGKSVTVNCLDSNGDGKCDSCGYQKYSTCDHKRGPWMSNDDGTHTSSCSCGKNTATEACQFIGSKCQLCGYEKHVDNDQPQKPAVDPKPVIHYKDYDNVPKTGDILSMVLSFFRF